MKLPPGSEANQRTTLSTARTVDAEQRTTRGGAAAAEGERGNKNAIYLLIYPRSIKYVKSTKQRGASQDSQTAQVSEAEADAGYAGAGRPGAGALYGNVRRKRF